MTEFEIGSFVLLQFHDSSFVTRRRPSKLSMNYKGPYRVISRNDYTRYEIENLVNQEIFAVYVKELRPFYHDNTINPKDLVRHAAGEFFVESIVDVQGDVSSRKSRSIFHVVVINCAETLNENEEKDNQSYSKCVETVRHPAD